jgi:transposase, IS5 family
MLRDRYEPMNLFTYIPTLSLRMDPVLTQMDTLLDDDTLFQAVKTDLLKRYPHTASDGRPSTPVEVILRMLVVKHLYGWSFPQTTHFVSDSLVLRQFCRVYVAPVPDQSTLNRWAHLIQPATLQRLLAHLVQLARQLQVTQGRKLRLDGTVVETTIHHPTDSTLLTDGVRVLSRALGKAKALLRQGPALPQEVFTDCTPQARQQMQRIMEVARQRGEAAAEGLKTTYRALLHLTTTVVARAQQVQAALVTQAPTTAHQIAATIAHYVPLIEQVITPTTRRVLQGEQVPASEKLVSLFEPHTAIIRKGKPGKPTEFGRVLWLAEVDGGLISQYAVVEGNADEKAQLPPSVDHHRQQCGHPPAVLAGDRGLHSARNERYARATGITEVVLPKPGRTSARRIAYEQQAWFQAGRHWRAGIEGRISGRKRRYGLARCRSHGAGGMERWVGLGLMAHDLHMIAQHLVASQGNERGGHPAVHC